MVVPCPVGAGGYGSWAIERVAAVGAFADENGSAWLRASLANSQPGGFPLGQVRLPDCDALVPIESCT
jgi:hypothetical protein